MTNYTCPVCAYSLMPYPVEEGNICPCCGTEFGFDDDLGMSFRRIRDAWVAAGTPWFSPIDPRPLLWNGLVQLILSGYEFALPEDMAPEAPQRDNAEMPGQRTNIRLELAA